MRKFSLILGLILIAIIVIWALRPSSLPQTVLLINQHRYQVEIANTPATQARGLSGRTSLANNQGMYFIFQDTKPRRFWMKEMKFPLDILWIKDHQIIAITANVPPPAAQTPLAKLSRYPSPEPVNKVLELPAGTAAKDEIKEGDTVIQQ